MEVTNNMNPREAKIEELYRVSGCGISVVCMKGESMLWWITKIIRKGGTPKISPFFPELERRVAA